MGGTGRGSGGDDVDDRGMGGVPGNKFTGRPSAAQAGAQRPGTVHGSMTGGGIDTDSSIDSDDSAELSGHDGKNASIGGIDDDSSDGSPLIDNDDDDDDNLNSDDLVDDDDDTVSENDF